MVYLNSAGATTPEKVLSLSKTLKIEEIGEIRADRAEIGYQERNRPRQNTQLEKRL